MNEQIVAAKKRYKIAFSKKLQNKIQRYEVKKKVITRKKRVINFILRFLSFNDSFITIFLFHLTKASFFKKDVFCRSTLSLIPRFIFINNSFIIISSFYFIKISSFKEDVFCWSTFSLISLFILINDFFITISSFHFIRTSFFKEVIFCRSTFFLISRFILINDSFITIFSLHFIKAFSFKEEIFSNSIDAKALSLTYDNETNLNRFQHQTFIEQIKIKNSFILLINQYRQFLNQKVFVHVKEFAIKLTTLTSLFKRIYLKYEILIVFIKLILKNNSQS